MSLACKMIESPIGKLKLVASEKGLVAILWEKDSPRRVPLGELIPNAQHPVLVETEKQLAGILRRKAKEFLHRSRYARHSFSEERMGSAACDTVWRNEKLRTACETTGESPGVARGRRRKWKKPGVNHRALPSRHRSVRKTYGLRRWTSGESSLAQPGKRN